LSIKEKAPSARQHVRSEESLPGP